MAAQAGSCGRGGLKATEAAGADPVASGDLAVREPGRSAPSAAAYAGLAPGEFRSGATVRRRTRLSKAGNPRLRKAL